MLVKRKAKLNKYRAKKVVVDGITFDSKAEARRWAELQLLERAGVISRLERQVSYKLYGMGQTHICDYRADFQYVENRTRANIIEDVKGVRTRDYVIKRKLFQDNYPGIEFREIRA